MNKQTLAPIALFVYNRPDHTEKTVAALRQNTLAKDSDLIIFSDGPKNPESAPEVESTRRFIKTISGFKSLTILERPENWGLAKSIIAGVTEIVNKYGQVIVLEDDLITSPYFLKYMNDALELYRNEERVISIHGYIYPTKKTLPETFFLRGADCWGWATWKRGWDLFRPDGQSLLAELKEKRLTTVFNLDNSYPYLAMLEKQVAGQNDSWAVRWHASAFLADKLTLYPGRSLVDNIGQDKSGVHGTQGSIYRTNVSIKEITVGQIAVTESLAARQIVVDYFQSLKPSLITRIIRRLRSQR